MPVSNSKDVYHDLVEADQETSWLLGLVSFAVFEERRIEWVAHFEAQNQRAPSYEEIEDWYKQQPNAALLRAQGEAENALKIFAQEVEERMLEDERKNIEQEIIVNEIRSLRKPWADFGVNVAAGLCSALLFAAVLTILALVIFVDASPVELGKVLFHEESTVIENGQKTSQ